MKLGCIIMNQRVKFRVWLENTQHYPWLRNSEVNHHPVRLCLHFFGIWKVWFWFISLHRVKLFTFRAIVMCYKWNWSSQLDPDTMRSFKRTSSCCITMPVLLWPIRQSKQWVGIWIDGAHAIQSRSHPQQFPYVWPNERSSKKKKIFHPMKKSLAHCRIG
jgi:hypothetical protein